MRPRTPLIGHLLCDSVAGATLFSFSSTSTMQRAVYTQAPVGYPASACDPCATQAPASRAWIWLLLIVIGLGIVLIAVFVLIGLFVGFHGAHNDLCADNNPCTANIALSDGTCHNPRFFDGVDCASACHLPRAAAECVFGQCESLDARD